MGLAIINTWQNIWQRWQRSQRFEDALRRQDVSTAAHYLDQMKTAGDRLSLLARTFAQSQQHQRDYQAARRDLAQSRRQISVSNPYLKSDPLQVDQIAEQLQRRQHDPHKIQYTGLFKAGFHQLEQAIADYLHDCFKGRSLTQLQQELQQASDDLNHLKKGLDPDYHCDWTPHVYFLRYFLDNTYCGYVNWFWLYELGLLKPKANILDVAAGPGTMIFGLALLLQRLELFTPDFGHQFSYLSLDKQIPFQQHGFQLWQQWMRSFCQPPNIFAQFQSCDVLTDGDRPNAFQKNSFDYIIISHCFFSDFRSQRLSHQYYKRLFQENLANNGYIILILQGLKLFCHFKTRMDEDLDTERSLIEQFCQELGVFPLHYQYATSTSQRAPMGGKEFGSFATQHLPRQPILSPLQRTYLNQPFDRHYVLDDYIIIAQPASSPGVKTPGS